MAVLWPLVKARLVAALPALAGFSDVTVTDGPPTDVTTGSYITVGYVQGGEYGGTFDMPDSPIDTLRDENGSVEFEIVSWDGDDLSGPEATVFDLFNTIDTWVRADQTLGVMSPGATSNLGATYVPVLSQEAGATARLVVTLTYFARH